MVFPQTAQKYDVRIMQVRASEIRGSPERVRRACKVSERKSELLPQEAVIRDAPVFLKPEIEISCSYELRITEQ
jgi:hypothetical protein